MLIKRLDPREIYLDHAAMQRGKMLGEKDGRWLLDQKRTRDAMQATSEVCDEFNTIFERRDDVAVLHDVRFLFAEAPLHVDHLFITDTFHIFLVESRTATNKFVFTRDHECISTDEKKEACAIPSPVKQLQRNRSILKRVFKRLDAETRFGRSIVPTFHQYVLIDKNAAISDRAGSDENCFVTIAQLEASIDAETKNKPILNFLNKMPLKTLRRIARQIANMHLPKEIRFAKKFQHLILPSFDHTIH